MNVFPILQTFYKKKYLKNNKTENFLLNKKMHYIIFQQHNISKRITFYFLPQKKLQKGETLVIKTKKLQPLKSHRACNLSDTSKTMEY